MPIKVGYARCSTEGQDLTAQREWLLEQGVAEDHILHGPWLLGLVPPHRPGLEMALAVVRAGDTLLVVKLDRLARSVRDALDILESLADKGVRFQLGDTVYDWASPMNKLFLGLLALVAEFEADLTRQRTKEGMAIARAKGKLKGRGHKLSPAQQRSLVREYEQGTENIVDLAKEFGVSRPTVYRVLARHAPKASPSPAAPGDALASRPNGDEVATPQPEVNLRPDPGVA